MGKTSAEVRNRWNDAHDDKVFVSIPKGYREKLRELAEANKTTVNSMVTTKIREEVSRGK